MHLLLSIFLGVMLLGTQDMNPAFAELRRVLETGSDAEKLECLQRIFQDSNLWEKTNNETVSLPLLIKNLDSKDQYLRHELLVFCRLPNGLGRQ